MFQENSCSISGVIVDIREGNNAFALLIRSIVAKKMRTEFPLFIKKELFSELNVNIGDNVAIINALVWTDTKRNKTRFSIKEKSQLVILKEIAEPISTATFSGEVHKVIDEHSSKVYILQQNVSKSKVAIFNLIVAKSISSETIEIGDTVYVKNAQAYQKDSEFRFRILEEKNIIKMNIPRDLGIVRPEDKFI